MEVPEPTDGLGVDVDRSLAELVPLLCQLEDKRTNKASVSYTLDAALRRKMGAVSCAHRHRRRLSNTCTTSAAVLTPTLLL
jgi:hypothetical protein